ncbi:hypothetical protein ACJMK2_043930 [Sinanodonta woodiana]
MLGLLPLNGGNELHYRIRYVPNKDSIHKLAKLCIKAFEYLYYQLKFDMVHEQFSIGVEDRDNFEKFFRGLAVIDMLISLRLKTPDGNDSEDNIAYVQKNVEQYLPPSLCRKNLFDRIFKPLETEMIKKLEEVRRDYTPEKCSVHNLMMNNVGFLLASVPSVYIEKYETFKFSIIRHATEKEGVTKIKFQRKSKMVLTLDFRSDENHLPSLQLSEVNPNTHQEDTQLRYPLCNLLGLSFSMVESDTETWWKVNINLRMGQDQMVYFSTESACLSFLMMVEGYCRLCCDHYHSLCEDVAPAVFKEMMAIKAHGPISKQYASQKLWNSRYVNEDFYLLRQNPKTHDQYELLMRGPQPLTVKSLTLGVITRNNGMYKLAEEYKGYRSIKELIVCKIRDMKENDPIPSEIKLPFSGECCDDLYELLLGKVMTFNPQNNSERSDKKAVPEVINVSAVEYLDKLGKGEFTEVSKARVKKHGLVAVKQLSFITTAECERYKFHECLLKGFQTSLLLNGEPRFFITFYGLSLTSPAMMIMKYAELGNFADLLRSRQPSDPISIEDRLETCTQVARGLLYMEENMIIHGSMCCKNLMAFKQIDGEIIVKIADPGLVHFYNQLPLDHNVNMKRLPWLAIELYDDMTKVTMETDLYAYGVLIWEIMSDAAHPFDKPPLKDMSHDERKRYYISGGTLGIPSMLEIDTVQQDGPKIQQTLSSVNSGKKKLREIMQQCWNLREKNRPRPKQLLRELYLIMQAYGVYSNYPSESSGESSHYYYAQDDDSNDKNDSLILYARKGAQQDPSIYVLNHNVLMLHPQVKDYSTISAIQSQNPQHNVNGQPDGEDNVSQLAYQSLLENQSTSPMQCLQTPSTIRLLPEQSQDCFTSINVQFVTSHQQVLSTIGQMSTKKTTTLIPSTHLTVNFEDKLGNGFFASVYSGQMNGKEKVAIKIFKSMPNAVQSLIRKEAEVMSGLNYKNIVRFHGLCIKDNYLVMEYVAGGSLQTFLKRNENKIPAHHLSRFCVEICQGMEYLCQEKIIHCDLATKNVLLTENNMNGTIKIADFGLARILAKDKDYYRRKTETSMPIWYNDMGNFGQVKRGILGGQPVAIKCLKTNFSGGDDAKRFMREIELLHKANHPNIVRLLGILSGHKDLFVMEYMENGNLRNYLMDQKNEGCVPKQTQLLRILKDIAAGMEYLTSINILHGDLTASNILLTGDLQAKVSDFGLGKVFNEVPYQRSEKAKFHYKWCAPEVLKYRTFNKTSDVWSYGVLLWEVFTYGEEPNYGDSFSASSRNPQHRFTEKVINDVKLPKPADCPDKIYQEIMIRCWAMKSENRPLFSDIKETLLMILKLNFYITLSNTARHLIVH